MVNLMPWRERLRERRKRRFLSVLVAATVLSLMLLLLLDRQLAGSIAAHVSENQRLRTEIGLLRKRGEEAGRLRREQKDIALHIQVLASLQQSRPASSGTLSELAAHLPDAAFYQQLERTGNKLRVEGVAESYAAIVGLMRNLSYSPWFPEVQLEDVSDADPGLAEAPGSFRFSLSLRLDSPGG